jgi:hypothetical protein
MKRDWKEYNKKLVKRGEIIIDKDIFLILCPIIENHRILYFFLHTFYFFSLINYTLC